MLEVLVLAPGRSGTTSVQTLLQNLCRANGCDWIVEHQTEQGALTEAAADAILRDDTTKAREVLEGWTHQIEVSGNQIAFLVPVFREVFGDDLRIIRLRREPKAHLRSLRTGPKVSPEVWGGYHDASSEYDGPIYWNLPTAAWFGEMDAAEWERLPTGERVRWYLETMQAWMDRGADLFEHRIDVRTEELNEPETIDRIAHLLNPAWTERVAPVHRNQRGMFDYSKLTVAQAKEARRVWEKFDFQTGLSDSTYLLRWAIQKSIEAADDPAAFLRDLEGYTQDLLAKHEGAQGEIRALERRLQFDPHDGRSFCRLMETYLRIDDAHGALRVAIPWVERNPDDARALMLVAEAAERAEDAGRARELRARAAALASA